MLFLMGRTARQRTWSWGGRQEEGIHRHELIGAERTPVGTVDVGVLEQIASFGLDFTGLM